MTFKKKRLPKSGSYKATAELRRRALDYLRKPEPEKVKLDIATLETKRANKQ